MIEPKLEEYVALKKAEDIERTFIDSRRRAICDAFKLHGSSNELLAVAVLRQYESLGRPYAYDVYFKINDINETPLIKRKTPGILDRIFSGEQDPYYIVNGIYYGVLTSMKAQAGKQDVHMSLNNDDGFEIRKIKLEMLHIVVPLCKQ